MNLDRIDQKIIRLLEGNSRLSFAELAEEVGLSKTPCWKRVKALEDAGVIRGYSLVVDPAKMGFGLEAFVQVTISPERYADFEAAVVRHPLIRRCHATTGEDDYLLQIIAVDMAELDALLRQEIALLPGVRRTVTSMITREIKTATRLADALARASA
jgi:Lrp/AsnC family transcriptional regulator, leucine-responsive regulatory protein